MAGWTNRLKYRMLGAYFRGEALPASFYVRLVTATPAPSADVNDTGQLNQIAVGNGYVDGGIQVLRNSTDWDVWTEDDNNDVAFIQIKDLVWTASGGGIPSSGAGARYAVLTDDAVATDDSREVYNFWDLSQDRAISTGQTLTLQNSEVRLTE